MSLGTLTLACLLLAAGNQPLDVAPIGQHAFDIPIRLDPARKAEIRELNLLVSTDQGKSWHKVAVATPDQTAFSYQAPSDGIYWFSISVIDQKGNLDPPDPFQVAPGLKVLVDTLPPQLRIRSAERQGEEVVVRWEIVDQYIDLATLRLQYRAADASPASWTPVSINPAVAGQASFRPGTAGPLKVRMEVQDLAQNPASAEADVAAAPVAPAAAVTGYVPAPVAPVGSPPPGWSPVVNQAAPPVLLRDPPPPRERSEGMGHAPGWGNPPTVAPADTRCQGERNPGIQVVASSHHGPAMESPGNVPAAAPRSPSSPAAPLRVVNSNRVTLDYEVAKFGPSGLRSVEVYVTRNEGRPWNWQRVGEQNIEGLQPQELQGPERTVRRSLAVDLQDDGVYGFYLVVRSGANRGKPPPQADDPPQMRVEVDRTPPEARLYAPTPDPNRRDALILRWTATDRNLANNPITLQWARPSPDRQQPLTWEPIGPAELPNTGVYVWQVPPGMPPSVYLRLIVRDTAGNSGVAETPEPVLIDLTEPEVRILSIGSSR
ncbi:MAG TPA: hypothetical protein VNK04_02225 [Gemmataceae bacterium]|nr:hypothetical protein [Gemmataceae bacterium]